MKPGDKFQVLRIDGATVEPISTPFADAEAAIWLATLANSEAVKHGRSGYAVVRPLPATPEPLAEAQPAPVATTQTALLSALVG